MRRFIFGALALLVFAGCETENRMTGDEIAAFLEGNTISHYLGAADYYDGRGNLTYIANGNYGRAKYRYLSDRICFSYPSGNSDCWTYAETSNPRAKKVVRQSDKASWFVTLVGSGNRLTQFE